MTEAKDDFDPNERIAAFSMVAIKRAITWVGIMDDRDDVKNVSEALKCPPRQALRVLEEMERRGVVVKTARRNQWMTTRRGHQLAFYWHPPRKFTPGIERDSQTAINEGFEEVPCSIWRSTQDEEEMFEEAAIDVALHVEYEGERLIEINVTQPDEYQGESAGSGLTAISVYLSPADAKRFAKGLHTAIERAEAEVARRAKKDEQKRRRAKVRRLKAADRERNDQKTKSKAALVLQRSDTAQTESVAQRGSGPRAERLRPQPLPADAVQGPTPPIGSAPEPDDARRGKAIAAALKELRETNRARLKPQR